MVVLMKLLPALHEALERLADDLTVPGVAAGVHSVVRLLTQLQQLDQRLILSWKHNTQLDGILRGLFPCAKLERAWT